MHLSASRLQLLRNAGSAQVSATSQSSATSASVAMSFGFSVGDIYLLSQLCSQTYQNWKHACGRYSEITGQLESLHLILERVDTDIKDSRSVFARQNGDFHGMLQIMGGCRTTITQLNRIVDAYSNLGSLVRSRKATWSRLRLSHTNYQELSNRLTSQTVAISAYLDAISASSLGRVESRLDDLHKMTVVIDKRAAEMRAGKHQASIWSVYTNDDKETWREFRRQLVGEGFTSESIKRHRHRLLEHLRELNEEGMLDEQPPTEYSSARGAGANPLWRMPEEIDPGWHKRTHASDTPRPPVPAVPDPPSVDDGDIWGSFVGRTR